jgi:acyl-CoA thioester hydrolase
MQNYTTEIIVKTEHIDDLQHVNNIQYVIWVQDIAIVHWEKAITKAISENYFWILLEHHIEYKKPAFLNDFIEVTTYIKENKGVTSTRCVEFYNKKTNTLLASSTTTWCLFNKISKKPNRITQEIMNCFK